jgi:hypothetical protein
VDQFSERFTKTMQRGQRHPTKNVERLMTIASSERQLLPEIVYRAILCRERQRVLTKAYTIISMLARKESRSPCFG